MKTKHGKRSRAQIIRQQKAAADKLVRDRRWHNRLVLMGLRGSGRAG